MANKKKVAQEEVAQEEVAQEEVAQVIEPVTITSEGKPLFSRIKDSKITNFAESVQGVQLNQCVKFTKHAIVNYYIARHSIAFTLSAKSKALKIKQSTIESLQETLEKLVIEGKEDTNEYFKQVALIEQCEDSLEKIKSDTQELLAIETRIINDAFDVVGDHLYKNYKSSKEDFAKALEMWFNSNNITTNQSLIDYFLYAVGYRSSTNRSLVDSGNTLQYKTKREFNKLFLDTISQLFKEKKVANFVRFEETLSQKASDAIQASRSYLAEKSEKELEKAREIEELAKYQEVV